MARNSSAPETFVAILKAMREVLLKYDYLEDADHASTLIDQLNLHGTEATRYLLHGGIWSGAGSLMDVVLSGDPTLGPADEVRRDETEYLRNLVRLSDEMKAQGIRDPETERWIEGVRKSRSSEKRRLSLYRHTRRVTMSKRIQLPALRSRRRGIPSLGGESLQVLIDIAKTILARHSGS